LQHRGFEMGRPSVDSDKELFLSTLEGLGKTAGNVTLREKLHWGDDRYWRTHSALLDEGTIVRGKGKGGSVSLVIHTTDSDASSQSTSLSADSVPTDLAKEISLYDPAKSAIETGWVKERGFDEAIVEITGLPGRRYTGGAWTRPDLAVVATKAYPYLPGRAFEIITFEIKREDAVNVTGVFEALSHLQFASQSYVVFCTAGKNLDTDFRDVDRILNLAKLHGVGVIAASDVKDYEAWSELVEPRRNVLDPEQANLFIGTCFSENAKARIIKWHK
jgi:hypothetical protein